MNTHDNTHNALEQGVARLRRGTLLLVLSTSIALGLIAAAEADRARLLETSQVRARCVELVDARGQVVATVDQNLVLRNAAGRICARLAADPGSAPRMELCTDGTAAVTLASERDEGMVKVHSSDGTAVGSISASGGGALQLGSKTGAPLTRLARPGGEPAVTLSTASGRKLVEVMRVSGDVSTRIHAGDEIAVGLGVTGAATGYAVVRTSEHGSASILASDDQYAGLTLRNHHGQASLLARPCLSGGGGRLLLNGAGDVFASVDLNFDSAHHPHVDLAHGNGDYEEYTPPRSAPAVSRTPSTPRRTSGGSPGTGETQCGACSGTGVRTCSSCFGSGSHAVTVSRVEWDGSISYGTEYQSCSSCSGGQSSCGSCGGTGRK